jgi:hypothetical protein
LVDEVAEGAFHGQGFGCGGAGGRAEKLKLGKQKAEIARPGAQRSAAPSCPPHLPVPCALISHFSLSAFPISAFVPAFRPPVSGFRLSAFQLFASWPVEQRALDLLLAGDDFDQAPNEIGSSRRSALFHL